MAAKAPTNTTTAQQATSGYSETTPNDTGLQLSSQKIPIKKLININTTPTNNAHHILPATYCVQRRETCDDIDLDLVKKMMHLFIELDINNNTYDRETDNKYFPLIVPPHNQKLKIKILKDNRLGRDGSGVSLVLIHLGLLFLTSHDHIVTLRNDLSSKHIYTIIRIKLFLKGKNNQLFIKNEHIMVRYHAWYIFFDVI